MSNAKVNWTKLCGLKIYGWDVGLIIGGGGDDA